MYYCSKSTMITNEEFRQVPVFFMQRLGPQGFLMIHVEELFFLPGTIKIATFTPVASNTNDFVDVLGKLPI